LTPEELAVALRGFVSEFGLALVGGCCGTTPEHIRQVAEAVREVEATLPPPEQRRSPEPEPAVSSMYTSVPFAQDAS
ncbi:homocysteine S-methyltransferase family protein, partial [Mycobacterium tuberculosis]|nr:homocysteine S-methyltransferase family protein [Mycobacterium tuberculosis]